MSICSTTSMSARAIRGLAAARANIPNARFCDSVRVTLGAKISISQPRAVAPVLDHLLPPIADELRALDRLRRKVLGRSGRPGRERAVQDQRGDPLRAHRGQQHRGGATLGDAEEHGPL